MVRGTPSLVADSSCSDWPAVFKVRGRRGDDPFLNTGHGAWGCLLVFYMDGGFRGQCSAGGSGVELLCQCPCAEGDGKAESDRGAGWHDRSGSGNRIWGEAGSVVCRSKGLQKDAETAFQQLDYKADPKTDQQAEKG